METQSTTRLITVQLPVVRSLPIRNGDILINFIKIFFASLVRSLPIRNGDTNFKVNSYVEKLY